MEDAKEFFKRSTDPEIFTTKDLCVWEEDSKNKNGRFKLLALPSEAKMEKIRKVLLTREDRENFDRDMMMLQNILDGKTVEGMKEWENSVLSY